MGHQALYRKWRPQTFEDLVGQDNISRTLINAINTNRVSHAYLFCGSRGTGKTSTARILAKSLNCEARVLGSPCNICPSCIEQLQGSALDVIEIDAASNRGISEIKSLIEQVRFASVSGKYKVYIIDEFHMLTTEAFNAILKTLEEPPEKVVFILATTEAHKILPTIISRCQKFDFQRIPVSALISRLRYISDQENIKISDDSLLSIARKANGGLRDALSLLDQINSFSSGDGEVANELVYQVLGMVSTDFLANLAIAISESDPVKIISTLTELIRAGNDPIVIMTETINFFRHLLIVKVSPEMAEHLEVPVTSIEVLKKISESFSKDDILENLGFLNEAIERVKKTQMAQLWLEINFVQLCKRAKISPVSITQQIPQSTSINNNEHGHNPSMINDLMNKINLLENKLSNLQESTIKNFNNIQTQVPQNHGENRNNDQIEKISNISEIRNTKNPDVNHKNSNMNLDHVWERMLHETKKISIASAALLCNGVLSDVDEKGTVLVRFVNEAFIEIMKKSKFENVEKALLVIFGKPYKLLMEKGGAPTENKISQFSSAQKVSSNNIQSESSEQNHNNTSNILVMSPPKIAQEINHEISETVISSIQVENTEDAYITSDEHLIKTEHGIKEISEEYISTSNSFNQSENSIITNQNIHEERFKRESTDKYFGEVTNTFKGKIINKNKSD